MICLPGKSMIFFTKRKQKKIELVVRPAIVQFYPDNEIQQALARANADQARKIQTLPPLLPQETRKSRLRMATSGSQKLNSR